MLQEGEYFLELEGIRKICAIFPQFNNNSLRNGLGLKGSSTNFNVPPYSYSKPLFFNSPILHVKL